MEGKDYTGLIGKLNYLAISTRPDIAFIAHTLSFFCEQSRHKTLDSGEKSTTILKANN